MTEGEKLAQFSELVRESSLKRFRKVVPGDRAWRPAADQLSFVDLLKHLIDADKWNVAILINEKTIPRAVIHPGDAKPEDWDRYLLEFEDSGKKKAEFLRKMSDDEFSQEVEDWEKMGKVTKWLILVRGGLDHEIHHRGSLQTMLNLKYKRA
jgi:uncharacterized damage-inducible protein DinB